MLIYGSQTNLSHGGFVRLWLVRVGFARVLKQVGSFIEFLRLDDGQNSSK